MKRIRMIGLLLCCALLLCACGKKQQQETPVVPEEPPVVEPEAPELPEEPEKPEESVAPDSREVAALRAMARDAGCLCAATYLGFGEDIDSFLRETEEGATLQSAWIFLQEIPAEQYVEYEGEEIYCIVPADPEARVEVFTFSVDESSNYAGRQEERLYGGEHGQVLLLRGNVSDIMPNISVTITDSSGRSLRYEPYLSLKDGALGLPEGGGVLDFTLRYPGRGYEEPGGRFAGTWKGKAAGEDGVESECTIVLSQDGTAKYRIVQKGELAEELTGSYLLSRADENSLRLLVMSTGGRNFNSAAPRTLLGEFMLVPERDGGLYFTHLYGDPLLPGLENTTVAFRHAG